MRLRGLRHPPALEIREAGYNDNDGQWDAERAAARAAVASRTQMPALGRGKRARKAPSAAAEALPAADDRAVAMVDVYDGDSEEILDA